MSNCEKSWTKITSRMGLTAAFVLGIGISAAQAQDETPGEKLDRALRDSERAAEEFAGKAKEFAEEAARSAHDLAQSALDALDETVRDLPQYEAPEMDENGDILIRRKRDEGEELSI